MPFERGEGAPLLGGLVEPVLRHVCLGLPASAMGRKQMLSFGTPLYGFCCGAWTDQVEDGW